MKTVKTMCARDCPDACWLDVYVENGTIVKVLASQGNPVTNGLTCPRAAGDPDRVTSMERVLHPYIKKKNSPGFNRVEWGEALSLVTSQLRETINQHGRESVLLLDYAGNTGYIAGGYSKRLWNALGVTMTDYTICSASGHAGINLHYGLSYGVQPTELEEKKTIVFWGFNAKTSSPHQWSLATRARRVNDAKIIVIDPRESETSEYANLWLGPQPGSDVALAYGVARYLITEGHVDLDFIETYTHGYEAYKKEALSWTPDRVEAVTGVDWRGVEEMCKVLTMEGSPVFMIGLGLNKSQVGAESCRAVSLLPALLGEHRGFYYSNSRGRCINLDAEGAFLTKKKPRTVSMVSLGERLARGEFKFVYVFNMNPAMTLPDTINVVRGFNREDVFLVVHDTHLTETVDLANVVLPATTYLEKDDIIISDNHPFVRVARKAIEPQVKSLDEHILMKIMAKGLDVTEAWVNTDPWLDMAIGFKDAFSDGDFDDLLMGKTLTLRSKPRKLYQTVTGRIEFSSKSAMDGVSPYPVQIGMDMGEDEFIMLNSSLPQYLHTQFRDVYNDIPCTGWINPNDATQLNLNTGEPVTLFNKWGKLHITLEPTTKVPQGVIWCPRELKDSEGNHQNSLTPGTAQRIGGGAFFNSVKVKIKQ